MRRPCKSASLIAQGLLLTGRAVGAPTMFSGVLRLERSEREGFYYVDPNAAWIKRGRFLPTAEELQPGFVRTIARVERAPSLT